jgi:hypothetical protein
MSNCFGDSPLSITANVVGLFTFAVATCISYVAYIQLTIGARTELEGYIRELERTRSQYLPMLVRQREFPSAGAQKVVLESVATELVKIMSDLSSELEGLPTKKSLQIYGRILWLGKRRYFADKINYIRCLKIDLLSVQLEVLIS